MQTVSTAYGKVVASPDRAYALRVTIEWDSVVPEEYQTLGALTIAGVPTFERELQTDMPATTRFVAGRASTELDMTLAGLVTTTPGIAPEPEELTIAWLLGQYQSTSPLYRQSALGTPVSYDMGLLTGDPDETEAPYEGVEFVRVFTGYIDDYTVDSAAGTATLVCLDGKANLTTAPQLPPMVTDLANMPLPTSEFALDTVIRPQYLTWPAIRADCILAAGMRGAACPLVGTLAVSEGVVFGPGKFGTALMDTSFVAYNLPRAVDGANLFFEFWATCTSTEVVQVGIQSDGSVNPEWVISAGIATNGFELSAILPSGAFGASWSGALPTDGLPHYFAASVNGTAARLSIDGAVQPFTVASMAGTAMAFAAVNCFDTASSTPVPTIEAVQITTESSSAILNDTFTPNAVLDPSLNNLTALPDIAGTDTWTVVQDIADAEQGIAFFTEWGIFRFLNRATLRSMPNVFTFSDTSGLVKLEQENAQAALANHIQVPVNQLAIQAFASVWDSPTAVAIRPRQKYSTVASTQNPVVDIGTAIEIIPATDALDNGHSGYRASRSADGTGASVRNLPMTVSQIGPTAVGLTITNPNAFTVWLVTPANAGFNTNDVGQPALSIGGRAIVSTVGTNGGGVIADSQWPSVFDGGALANPAGEILLALSSNVWRQDLASCQQLADDILSDLAISRPQWNDVTVVACPPLQIGDRVTLIHEASGMNEDAIVNRIELNDDMTMSLDLRAVRAPGGWLLGQLGDSELGSDATNSTIWV